MFRRRHECVATELVMELQSEIDRLRERDEWLQRQLNGCIEEAKALEVATHLATARGLISDLLDAYKAVARDQRSEGEGREDG